MLIRKKSSGEKVDFDGGQPSNEKNSPQNNPLYYEAFKEDELGALRTPREVKRFHNLYEK